MNKLVRKAMVLALAGTMTMTMGTSVFAANDKDATSHYTNNRGDDVSNTDTSAIDLLKDYVNGSSSQSATKSPEETFTFTIERYGLWNVGEDGNGQAKYTKDTMPTFLNGSENTFTITAAAGTAGNTTEDSAKPSTEISLPTYEAVGDYWYKVTEKDSNVAGVLYGSNDNETEDTTVANGNHKAVYYLHVQVTNAENKGEYIRTVTLHKTAPDTDTVTSNNAYESWYADNNNNDNSIKVNDIQNKYYAGSLNISKVVTGNAGDKNELFKVTVVFTNDSAASMNSDITYKNFYDAKGNLTADATSLDWTDSVTGNSHSSQTKTVDFYVKDGTTVSFDNIPYGVSYKVTETEPTDDKYTHTFSYEDYTEGTNKDDAGTFNGVATAADTVTAEGTSGSTKWDEAMATGSISDDADTVTITNDKESAIDVGVITSNAPYIAVLILAGAVAVLYIRRRKVTIEE